jgi:hypothetical protein
MTGGGTKIGSAAETGEVAVASPEMAKAVAATAAILRVMF